MLSLLMMISRSDVRYLLLPLSIQLIGVSDHQSIIHLMSSASIQFFTCLTGQFVEMHPYQVILWFAIGAMRRDRAEIIQSASICTNINTCMKLFVTGPNLCDPVTKSAYNRVPSNKIQLTFVSALRLSNSCFTFHCAAITSHYPHCSTR
jgi:hypothetical protein